MKTLHIPKFDAYGTFQNSFVKVKVKNKMNTKDYQKVIAVLPGFPQGYVKELYDIVDKKEPIEVVRFYDKRQRGSRKLKGYFITIVE